MLPMIENVSLVTQVRQNCRRIKTRGAARVDWWQILAHGILRGHSPTCPPSVTAKLNSKLFWELKTQLLQMLQIMRRAVVTFGNNFRNFKLKFQMS